LTKDDRVYVIRKDDKMELLLLSNSRTPNRDYLYHARAAIDAVAAGRRRALFLPFASVTRDWASFTDLVASVMLPLGIQVESITRYADPVAALHDAELLLVGGGNTFRLLYECRQRGLLSTLAERVRAGVPYIGWSAGANLACPSIGTTNDMPIIDPGGLGALDLVPFQINPLFTNVLPLGQQAETRNDRIAEFLELNPLRRVIGVPEGCWLHVKDGQCSYHGPRPARLFVAGDLPLDLVDENLTPYLYPQG